MNEQTLLKLALAMTCIGLVMLFFLTESLELDQTAISAIDRTAEVVKIQGTVSSVFSSNTTTFLEVAQPSSITVVVFDNLDTVQEGAEVEIIGRVEEYQGGKEIIANRIRTIQG